MLLNESSLPHLKAFAFTQFQFVQLNLNWKNTIIVIIKDIFIFKDFFFKNIFIPGVQLLSKFM